VIANACILVMVLRLFQLLNSMTSLSCFVMATVLLMATQIRWLRRAPVLIHLLGATMLVISASVLFLGVSPGALHAIGRNPTLTERTWLWGQLVGMVENPVLGTGFESFWLGSRLAHIWALNPWMPNQAHNGYLEVYLNLGWVGLALVMLVLGTGYTTVFSAWKKGIATGGLGLSYVFVVLVFNFTEAAFFRIQAAAWLFCLVAIIRVPGLSGVMPGKREKVQRPSQEAVPWAFTT
jgi:O-antigen ligase